MATTHLALNISVNEAAFIGKNHPDKTHYCHFFQHNILFYFYIFFTPQRISWGHPLLKEGGLQEVIET